MSAIAGIYHTNGESVPYDHSGGIMESLQKYPADDVQTWQSGNIFLGCHAQWITPESVGEQLPFYDHESRLAITADAIIDNRDELFEKLQVDHGYRKQMTDSELILRAYQKWGEQSPKYLVGDFAYMIWDEREQKLFGARDFSGARTLYYYQDGRRFVFCTVMMPFFSLPYIKKELNERWMAEFLAMPGMGEAVNPISTVYKNVNQIPPSHSISIVDGVVKFSRYCTLNTDTKLKLKSNQEYEEAFREVLRTAVTEQMRTHRRVGARLSGGLDSGSVVSFASRNLRQENKELHTFSYIPVNDFTDWTPKSRIANERPYIESTVKHIGNIKAHYCDFEGKSPYSEVNNWLEILEMPYKFFENSYWIMGIYQEASKQDVGVLLDGGRGNYTISFGSPLDYYAILLRRLSWVRLNHELQFYIRNRATGRKQVLRTVGKMAFPILNKIIPEKDQYHFPMLIHPNLAGKTGVYAQLREKGVAVTSSSVPNAFEARRSQFQQLNAWSLTGTNKTKLSLRYALSDRDPTNDLRVVKFCLSVPDEQFVQNGLDRALIRRSMKNLLPDKVRLNHRVRGIQGADGVHRMKPLWKLFIKEVEQMCRDSIIADVLNLEVIQHSLLNLKENPKPEFAYNADLKVLMRSLIVYRFIKSFV